MDTLRLTTSTTPEPVDGEAPPPEPERVDLFEIDGVMYRMLADPTVPTMLRVYDAFLTGGDLAGNRATIVELCGVDAWDALKSYKDLTFADLETVVKAALEHGSRVTGFSGN